MIGKARFDKLLEPFHIGQVQTRNRMVKTAAGTGYADPNGCVGEKGKAFYEALARGGVGLIMVELPFPESPGGYYHTPGLFLHLDNDKHIQSFWELTRTIHKYGCRAFLQLLHMGPWLDYSLIRARDPISASALNRSDVSAVTRADLAGTDFQMAREATVDDIKEVRDKFGQWAERAHKAGFDGVEIQADTYGLFPSFLSRVWNRRQDAYGCQSLENRARLCVDVIREIKKRLGQDFPVAIVIFGAEFGIDKGTTIEEAQGFAQILQDAGADAIEVRAHGYGQYGSLEFPEHVFYPEPPEPLPKGLDWSRKGAGAVVPLAAAIKKVVSIPVITVGRLDPVLGEKILREGKADFIGFNRRLFADPELPNKIASGRLEEIRPCVACMECANKRDRAEPVQCRVNAALGGAEDYEIKQAEKKKRVVVVGGGPAGMEAARVAAIRGHEVILHEREPKLGGLLPLAALVKGLEIEDLVAVVRYLKTQITKLGVKIRPGKEFNPSVIEEIKPDVVILATGGIPVVPEIPGINQRNVVSNADLHRRLKIYLRFLGPKVLRWLTRFWMPVGKRVVIIGGQLQGCELAEFLVKRGRKVTIVDTVETLGEGLIERHKTLLFSWLTKRGVTMMTGVKYEEITDKGLTITKEGNRQTIEADTIVPAMPFRSNTELLKTLEGKVPEIYSIGDCSEPRLIIDAIADGYRTARAI